MAISYPMAAVFAVNLGDYNKEQKAKEVSEAKLLEAETEKILKTKNKK